MDAVAAAHPSSTWTTYRQAQAFGGQVRKGERGCLVVYFGATTKEPTRASWSRPATMRRARSDF